MTGEGSKWLRYGAIVLMASLAVLVGTLVLHKHVPHLFKKSKTFEFFMREARGVSVGTPVWVKGLEAGEVIAMEPEIVPAEIVGGTKREGKILAVKATCRVFSPYHRLLRKGSTVEILLLSLIGKPRVHVFPGIPGMPRTPDGDVLGKRIVRGMEGEAEEFLDRSETLSSKYEEVGVYAETLGGNLEDMDTRFQAGNNTLASLLQNEQDRERMQKAARRMDDTVAVFRENIDVIRRNGEKIAPEDMEALQKDASVAGDRFAETWKNIQALRGPWDVFQTHFDRMTAVARKTVDKTKTFQQDFFVFLNAKDVHFPEILASWYVIQKNLVVDTLLRLKASREPVPQLEDILQRYHRGRIVLKRKR